MCIEHVSTNCDPYVLYCPSPFSIQRRPIAIILFVSLSCVFIDACTRVTDDYPMIRRPQANLPPDVCPVSHSAMFLKETSSAVLTKSSGPPDDDAVAEVLAKAHENSHGSIVEAPSTSKSIANNGQWASSHVFLTQLPSTVHEIASEIDQGDGSDAGIYSEGPPLSSDEDDGEHETSSPNTSSRDYEADAKRDSSTLEAALASSRSAKGASKQKRKTKRVRRQVSSDGAESNGDEGSQERPEFRRGGFPYRDSLKAARTLGQQKQSSMSCAGRESKLHCVNLFQVLTDAQILVKALFCQSSCTEVCHVQEIKDSRRLHKDQP